jgi:pyridoxal phosphate enzyme (YggS family)
VTSLAERYSAISSRIDSAASSAGRNRDEIELVVITKNHPASLVLELLELGATNFGENRDQEAKPKALEVAAAAAGRDYRWHFVGQLQSNKVKSALEYASVIHSLDRESLLQALQKAVELRTSQLDVFIQLNLTEDPGRGGIQPAALKPFAEKVLATPNLNLLGVMGVAALDRDPAIDFETIRSASTDLQQLYPAAKYISAGMSEDFEVAIKHGATHLRIGSAITGNRQY